MPRLLFARRDDILSSMNNTGYIFIVRRLGKQSKLILSRSDSISNFELNLNIHGPCGPNAHAGADLQAFLTFCFKPILLSAHKLILLIYGDNSRAPAPPSPISSRAFHAHPLSLDHTPVPPPSKLASRQAVTCPPHWHHLVHLHPSYGPGRDLRGA